MTLKLQFDIDGNITQRVVVLPGTEMPGFEDAPEWLDFNTEAYKDAYGEIRDYSEAQLKAKAIRPPYPAVWSNVTMRWEDRRSIEDLKFDRLRYLKNKRQEAIETPKQTSVGLFDADEVSQNNLNKVIALVKLAVEKGGPAEANYTLATNERRTFTLEELETAALEIGFQVQQIFDIADELRTNLNRANTPEQIELVRWPSM